MMKRSEDRLAVYSLDRAIGRLEGIILAFDREHFPSRVKETRLDILVNADKNYLRKRREQRKPI